MKNAVSTNKLNVFYNLLATRLGQEKDPTARELFQKIEVSQNMKDVVQEAMASGDDSLGLNSYVSIGDPSDGNADVIKLTQDLVDATVAAINADKEKELQKNTIHYLKTDKSPEEVEYLKMWNRFTLAGYLTPNNRDVDLITYQCLDLIHRYDKRALNKVVSMPTKDGQGFLKINQEILWTGKEAIDWLFDVYRTTDLHQAIALIKKSKENTKLSSYNRYASPQNIFDVLCGHIVRALTIKTAGELEENSALLESYDKERYPGEFVEDAAKTIPGYLARFQKMLQAPESYQTYEVKALHSLLVERCTDVINYANSSIKIYEDTANTRTSALQNFYTKLAQDEYDSPKLLPSDDVDFGVQCDTQEECFLAFIENPSKETFQRTIEVISAELSEGDTYGRNVATELASLAERTGQSWITEDNIQFLYELYTV